MRGLQGATVSQAEHVSDSLISEKSFVMKGGYVVTHLLYNSLSTFEKSPTELYIVCKCPLESEVLAIQHGPGPNCQRRYLNNHQVGL